MKTLAFVILLALWLVLAAINPQGADLQISLTDLQSASRAKVVTLTPVSIPTVGTNSVTLFSSLTQLATNGTCYFSNILAGSYKVKVFDSGSNLVFNFAVPSTNGLVNLKNLLTNTVTLVTNYTVYGTGLSVTNKVLMTDATTNLQIFSGGILVSNITNYSD